MATSVKITELGSGIVEVQILDLGINPTDGIKAHDILKGPLDLFWLHALNYDTAKRHWKLYDAVTITEGTTEPDYGGCVGAASGSVPGIFLLDFGTDPETGWIKGHRFVNGLCAVAATSAGKLCTAGATNFDVILKCRRAS